MKTHRTYHYSNFFLSEAEIQGLLHPAEANLGYFLARFLSLQLPSTQTESPLAHKCQESFKVRTQPWTEIFVFRSGLPRVYCVHKPNCWLHVATPSLAHAVSLSGPHNTTNSVGTESRSGFCDGGNYLFNIILKSFRTHILSPARRLHFPPMYLY
jgi:hypothetical protein